MDPVKPIPNRGGGWTTPAEYIAQKNQRLSNMTNPPDKPLSAHLRAEAAMLRLQGDTMRRQAASLSKQAEALSVRAERIERAAGDLEKRPPHRGGHEGHIERLLEVLVYELAADTVATLRSRSGDIARFDAEGLAGDVLRITRDRITDILRGGSLEDLRAILYAPGPREFDEYGRMIRNISLDGHAPR